jgi:hypothetical protein
MAVRIIQSLHLVFPGHLSKQHLPDKDEPPPAPPRAWLHRGATLDVGPNTCTFATILQMPWLCAANIDTYAHRHPCQCREAHPQRLCTCGLCTIARRRGGTGTATSGSHARRFAICSGGRTCPNTTWVGRSGGLPPSISSTRTHRRSLGVECWTTTHHSAFWLMVFGPWTSVSTTSQFWNS